MTRKPVHHRKPHPAGTVASHPAVLNDMPSTIGHPVFAQPQPTDDPEKFKIPHGSDNAAYKKIDELNKEHKLEPMPFPNPRGYSEASPEPVLTLAQILDAKVDAITKSGQLVFHCVGDTGSTRGPASQNMVADKLTSDFDEADKADIPAFFFHLGDVIYNFGEAKYYYDQFYEPYREYPAPIFALAGNHDGMVAPGTGTPTLTAFLENFCQEDFVVAPEAGGLSRTAQIQPGVFFTFEAPFVRIICLYSNTLEDPGVIADPENGPVNIGGEQLVFLKAALTRVKTDKFAGAVILGHHHPAYTAGSQHGWSVDMLAQIDAVCTETGVWPHAVVSGHAHNYQRFTRQHGKTEIAYIIAGNGGHAVAKLARKKGAVLRTPIVVQAAGGGKDEVTLESYDDVNYGYLRMIVNAATLTIEYHPASDGTGMKTPDDTVTIDLARRTVS